MSPLSTAAAVLEMVGAKKKKEGKKWQVLPSLRLAVGTVRVQRRGGLPGKVQAFTSGESESLESFRKVPTWQGTQGLAWSGQRVQGPVFTPRGPA